MNSLSIFIYTIIACGAIFISFAIGYIIWSIIKLAREENKSPAFGIFLVFDLIFAVVGGVLFRSVMISLVCMIIFAASIIGGLIYSKIAKVSNSRELNKTSSNTFAGKIVACKEAYATVTVVNRVNKKMTFKYKIEIVYNDEYGKERHCFTNDLFTLDEIAVLKSKYKTVPISVYKDCCLINDIDIKKLKEEASSISEDELELLKDVKITRMDPVIGDFFYWVEFILGVCFFCLFTSVFLMLIEAFAWIVIPFLIALLFAMFKLMEMIVNGMIGVIASKKGVVDVVSDFSCNKGIEGIITVKYRYKTKNGKIKTKKQHLPWKFYENILRIGNLPIRRLKNHSCIAVSLLEQMYR